VTVAHKDPVARREYQKSYRAANRSLYLNRYRRAKYGLTADEADQMIDAQNGQCLICGRPPGFKRPLVVDHNHRTGHVRGFLCVSCNTKLAAVEDRQWLRIALKYLAVYQMVADNS
jgi:hypothetical protein